MTLSQKSGLIAHVDCIVILTGWSVDAEFAQVIYQYAVQFAKYLPVILVQPDLTEARFEFEATEIENLLRLHVFDQFDQPEQGDLLNQALLSRRWIKPLLWIYNPLFVDWISHRYAPLKVYHILSPLSATDDELWGLIQPVLNQIDLFIPANNEVRESFRQQTLHHEETWVWPGQPGAEAETWNVLTAKIVSLLTNKPPLEAKLNILILYDDWSTHTNTVMDYLNSFVLFSRHNIFFAPGVSNAQCMFDMPIFDVVVLHYSVRLCYDWHISPDYVEALVKFGGLKLMFIQDEYDHTEMARTWFEKLGLHAIFTCVPPEYREAVYPSARFPQVEFIQVLTGYVPFRYEAPRPTKPLSQRQYLIGYRGRALPPWYGNLGQEKLIIGQRMRQICDARGLKTNIEWEEDKRIYGDKWDEFIEDCRATLGTESGANVFDETGQIRDRITAALEAKPKLSYQQIHRKYLAKYEGKVKMNQISPRVFEAIVHKTALVLFEGTYSGIVKPDVHYIPLKKDFSNVDEVITKLQDDAYLKALTERAYADIIASGHYSYRQFIKNFDQFLAQRLTRSKESSLPILGLLGSQPTLLGDANFYFSKKHSLRSMPTNLPLRGQQINQLDTLVVSEVDVAGLVTELMHTLPASDLQLHRTPTQLLAGTLLYRIKAVYTREAAKIPGLLPLGRFFYRLLKSPARYLAQGLWRLRPQCFRNVQPPAIFPINALQVDSNTPAPDGAESASVLNGQIPSANSAFSMPAHAESLQIALVTTSTSMVSSNEDANS